MTPAQTTNGTTMIPTPVAMSSKTNGPDRMNIRTPMKNDPTGCDSNASTLAVIGRLKITAVNT